MRSLSTHCSCPQVLKPCRKQQQEELAVPAPLSCTKVLKASKELQQGEAAT